MKNNTLSLFLLAIFMSASMFAQTAPRTGDRVLDPKPSILPLEEASRLADKAVQELLKIEQKMEAQVPKPSSPFSLEGFGREQRVRQQTRMGSSDIIFNFASQIYRGRPSPRQVCTASSLLNDAVKRHLEKSLGPNPSTGRKVYGVDELLRANPLTIGHLYENIGVCQGLNPWIEKK